MPSPGPLASTTIGLVAAWGDYPIVVARALKKQGYRVVCLAVVDHADPVLANICDDLHWIGWGKLGGAIRYFKRQGVQLATMAGKYHKVNLYQPWVWLKHLPDWRAVRRFAPHFLFRNKDNKDDTLLTALIDDFAMDGITFAPATDFAPDLLVRLGCLSRRKPSAAEMKDIEFGWRLAKELGRVDVGQSVAVKCLAALAVEAIEGTDACIRRAGTLCRSGGFTVVKVAKPQQDMRFDVPTIGMGTLETMVEAGAKVLAVEAGQTILIDEPRCAEFANRHKLVVVALKSAASISEDVETQAA